MTGKKSIPGINIRSLVLNLTIPLIFSCTGSAGSHPDLKKSAEPSRLSDSDSPGISSDYPSVITLLVLPENPGPGEPFRILATGGENIRKAKIIVNGQSGSIESLKSKIGEELPYWRIDDFPGSPGGKYTVSLVDGRKVISNLDFTISAAGTTSPSGMVWKTLRGWDSSTEAIYSAWVSALFYGCDERASWSALHEVTQDKNQNFLYNFLSLGEDDPQGKTRLIMQPDCADNPFYLRAYFAWKMGLPFGFHLSDRGSLVHNPKTSQWITNEISTSKTNPVLAFNSFLRQVMNGVHSGSARTALDDEKSDYYPVPLTRETLLPGVVFADPYGHTLIIVGWAPQTSSHPGALLAVDAQPDGTVGIKRFWKGNFLFNTAGVVGEPGFKAFRPISVKKGVLMPMSDQELVASSGFIPFSLQQRKMRSDVFYHTMERLINPKPLDPEAALLDLIQALHEQLIVRVTSVANGEAYLKSHPGSVIPMPSGAAAIFQSGGQWEDFSTPNRDLRLLIAMDAILDFPDLIVRSPEDFNISGLISPEKVREKLLSVLEKKVSELSVTYTGSDGSPVKLSVGEVLKRRDAFEMAYNPNDCIETRWGAPDNSAEKAKCHRHAPSSQFEKMRSVRTWFNKRLHPPT
jgi:hypothetical protein